MRKALAFLAFLLALALFAACTPAPPPQPERVSGFADGHQLLGASDSQLATDLDGMKAAGADYLRTDVDWWLIQPQRNVFDWSSSDRIIAAANARGLKVIGMLGYAPPWARPGTPVGDDKYPPADNGDYAYFAAAAAGRYPGVTWEVWNEPNLNQFWHGSDAQYGALLSRTYPAIKGIAPGATVVSAGLSPACDCGGDSDPLTFVGALAGNSYDVLGLHPSTYPYLPTTPYPENTFLKAQRLHDATGKQVWGTEIGYPLPGPGTTAQGFADYIKNAYDTWRSWSFTGPLIWYGYRDHGPASSGDVEDHFGIVTVAGVRKQPAYDAFVMEG